MLLLDEFFRKCFEKSYSNNITMFRIALVYFAKSLIGYNLFLISDWLYKYHCPYFAWKYSRQKWNVHNNIVMFEDSLFPTENIKYWYHKTKCNRTNASPYNSELLIMNKVAAAAFNFAGRQANKQVSAIVVCVQFCLQPKVFIF